MNEPAARPSDTSMDAHNPTAPCYVCGRPTAMRLHRTWVVDSPGAEDDGVVLLPSTPVCDSEEEETSCFVELYSATMTPRALSERIRARFVGFMRVVPCALGRRAA